MLITSHYWDPKSPRLFKKNDIAKYTKLKVIGDITCDINGSIPTTLKSTTIKNPYFYLNPITFEEVEKNNDLSFDIDLGITDAITDKHRTYAPSFVIPVK